MAFALVIPITTQGRLRPFSFVRLAGRTQGKGFSQKLKTDMKKNEKIQAFLRQIESCRERLERMDQKGYGEKITLPPAEIIEIAICGALNSRTGQWKTKAPTFRENPLASLFWRLRDFHKGGGYLGTVFTTKLDAENLCRLESDACGSYWTDKRSRVFDHQAITKRHGLDGETVWQQLDTLAAVVLGGKSNAAEAWRRALHG